MYILYGLAFVCLSLSYVFFKTAKRSIGNIFLFIGMFLNPFGYDLVVYGITLLTNSYWFTMCIMYIMAGIFFGLFMYLYNINPIRAFHYHRKETHKKLKLKVNNMSKTFDELYNDFFKKNTKTTNQTNTKKDKLFDMLTNPIKLEEQIEKMGKPDKVEFYNEGNLFFEKRTWHTKYGDVVKLIVSDEPYINVEPIPEKSLEEKLSEAVADENYEKAAIIRDLIANNKNK